MTNPQHDDGDEDTELAALYELRAQNQAQRLRIEEMIAEREGTPAEELVQRRRRSMRGLAWIPTVGGGAEVIRRVANRRNATIVSAAAAVAGTAFVAGALIAPGQPDHRAPTSRRPAALPPHRQQPVPTTPPKSGPPTSPPQVPSPAPQPTEPAALPTNGDDRSPTSPPLTQPSAPEDQDEGDGSGTPTAPITTRTCRIYLPALGLCVLPLDGGLVKRVPRRPLLDQFPRRD